MKDRMTIIFFSGSMDKATAMLILATTAASMGMEVSVFVTFWGLGLLKRGKKYRKKGIMQRILEFMLPGNRNELPLSDMNMLGMGPAMMKKLMEKTKTPSVDELLHLAKEFKVKFYACSTSCGVMGVDRENLIDVVDDVVGAPTFLQEAREAKINLFI